ncbi:MAG TPA: hypothetical protein VN285_04855 [Candidatus Deferrimicrobium sp.]|nr:hypothetical protein [Candidatus Deferrimicrobium sp.]
MELWKTLIVPSLVSSSVFGLLTLLFRKSIQRWFDRNLEQYKSELEIGRIEHSTRFSLLHQRRAEVIGIVYGRLVKASRLLEQLVEPLQPVDDRSLRDKTEEVRLAILGSIYYHDEHRIYLDDDVCTLIDEFHDAMRRVFAKFRVAEPGDKYTPDPSGQWEQSWRDLQAKLPPIKMKLELQFRNALATGQQAQT